MTARVTALTTAKTTYGEIALIHVTDHPPEDWSEPPATDMPEDLRLALAAWLADA